MSLLASMRGRRLRPAIPSHCLGREEESKAGAGGPECSRATGVRRIGFAAAALVIGLAAASGARAAETSTTVISSHNPSGYQQPVRLTIKVSGSSGGAPSGTVSVNMDSSEIATGLPLTTLGVGQPLAVGTQHICVLTSSNRGKCWGQNGNAQLGGGTTNFEPVPVDVTFGGLADVAITAIAAGDTHTCAVTASGGVKCWGDNQKGQLGNGTTTGASPVDVSGLDNAAAIVAGYQHTCVLTTGGRVKCWGFNNQGQLGDGSTTNRSSPVDVSHDDGDISLYDIVSIAAGFTHTCALNAAGRVRCWGNNLHGQLGYGGTGAHSNLPIDVIGLTDVTSIAAFGDNTCAVTSAGDVKCWGNNEHGQLGDGTTTDSGSPVAVSGISGVAAVAGGFGHTCALTTAGAVKCWGLNSKGELGDGSTTNSLSPVDVSGVSGAAAISAAGLQAGSRTCALTSAGAVTCWGAVTSNDAPIPTPTAVSGLGNGSVMVFGQATYTTSSDETAPAIGDRQFDGIFDPASGSFSSSTGSLTQTVLTRIQTVSFTSTAPTVVGSTYFPAATASSGLPVTFSVVGDCGIDETFTSVHLSFPGNCAVMADQAGDDILLPVQETQNLTLGQCLAAGTVTASPSPAVVGQAVTITAQVTPQNCDGNLTITGTIAVDFGDGTPNESGGVSVSTTHTYAAVGTYTLAANYSGDGNYAVVADGSAVTLFSLTVGKASQTISFTSTAPASATVGGATYTPSATATSGLAVTIGASGACSKTGSVVHFNAVGTCTVTANQGGDSTRNAAPPKTQAFSVGKGVTTTTMQSSPTTSKPGQQVTFTAKVAVSETSVKPAGSVTFKDGTTTLGTKSLASGSAQLSTSALTLGSHTITANYAGSSNFKAGSGMANVTVSAAVGPEVQVNTTAAGSQQMPAVAALKSGYVVGWASNGQDGSGLGIFAQRYAADGTKAGGELAVNTFKTGAQTSPAVAGFRDSSGGFVVIWQSAGEDHSGTGVYGQRFTASGAKSGAEFKINTTTASDQTQPSVAALAGGGFVAAWTSSGQDGSGLGVYAQIYTASGAASGSEFKVNTTTAGDQSAPSVAALSIGFVIAWQSNDGAGLGIYAQRFTAAGAKAGGAFKVNAVMVNNQSLPSVAPIERTGGFVIAWQSMQQDGSGLGVYAQRYSSTGARLGGETRSNARTAGDQGPPRAADFSNGGYIIIWTSKNQDGSGAGVYAQAYKDDGTAVNVEFRANTITARDQYQPSVAAFAAGNFVAVWTSQSSDGTLENIHAQRFLLPGTR